MSKTHGQVGALGHKNLVTIPSCRPPAKMNARSLRRRVRLRSGPGSRGKAPPRADTWIQDRRRVLRSLRRSPARPALPQAWPWTQTPAALSSHRSGQKTTFGQSAQPRTQRPPELRGRSGTPRRHLGRSPPPTPCRRGLLGVECVPDSCGEEEASDLGLSPPRPARPSGAHAPTRRLRLWASSGRPRPSLRRQTRRRNPRRALLAAAHGHEPVT